MTLERGAGDHPVSQNPRFTEAFRNLKAEERSVEQVEKSEALKGPWLIPSGLRNLMPKLALSINSAAANHLGIGLSVDSLIRAYRGRADALEEIYNVLRQTPAVRELERIVYYPSNCSEVFEGFAGFDYAFGYQYFGNEFEVAYETQESIALEAPEDGKSTLRVRTDLPPIVRIAPGFEIQIVEGLESDVSIWKVKGIEGVSVLTPEVIEQHRAEFILYTPEESD